MWSQGEEGLGGVTKPEEKLYSSSLITLISDRKRIRLTFSIITCFVSFVSAFSKI